MKLKIGFHAKEEEPADLVWPRGGIKDFVAASTTAHLLTLRRRDPFTVTGVPEIGKLNFEVRWKTHNDTDYTMSNFASSSDKPEAPAAAATEKVASTSSVGAGVREQRRHGISVMRPDLAEEAIQAEGHEGTGGPTTSTATGPDNYVKAAADMLPETADGFEKACPFCTLLNPAEAVVCDVCGGIFP